MMRLGNPFDNWQTEAEPSNRSRAGFVYAIEAFEDPGEVLSRNTGPGIGHVNTNGRRCVLDRRSDVAAGGCIADRIIQQVEDKASQQVLVTTILQVVRRNAFQCQLACRGQRAEGSAAACEEFVDVEFAEFELDVSGIRPREIQQVFSQY